MRTSIFSTLPSRSQLIGFASLAAAAAVAGLQPQEPGAEAPIDATTAPSPSPRISATLAWSDFDGDGLLDAAAIGAEGRVALLRNSGDGSLEDVTEIHGVDVTGASLLSWADFDSDGLSDLFVGTLSGPSFLLRNEGGAFADVAERSGIDHVARDLSAEWLDWDLDGELDLHVMTASGNFLYHSRAGAFIGTEIQGAAGPLASGFGNQRDDPAADRAADRGASTGTSRNTTLNAASPGGQLSGGSASSAGGAGAASNLGPTNCPIGVDDLAYPGSCISASTTPVLGSLYPLSSNLFVNDSTGHVSLGSTLPNSSHRLFVNGAGMFGVGGGSVRIATPGGWPGIIAYSTGFTRWDMVFEDEKFRLGSGSGPSTQTHWLPNGNVGMGIAAPTRPLHIRSADNGVVRIDRASANPAVEFNRYPDGDFNSAPLSSWQVGASTEEFLVFDAKNSSVRLTIDNSGLVSIKESLEIRGGADIVERFESSCGELEPGTVVAIDPEQPGALICAYEAYDTKVAGVVSGAGGVNPGICLGQDGKFEGDTPLAMTGRVYVKCSAENGAIAPGDRLTTAALAGHAMKATDKLRADGAVIGKAMSNLDEGTGLVLVLVNLQ